VAGPPTDQVWFSFLFVYLALLFCVYVIVSVIGSCFLFVCLFCCVVFGCCFSHVKSLQCLPLAPTGFWLANTPPATKAGRQVYTAVRGSWCVCYFARENFHLQVFYCWNP
jgi:hypothetical protein